MPWQRKDLLVLGLSVGEGEKEELPRGETRAQSSRVDACRLGKKGWSYLPDRGRSTGESPDARERMRCPSIPGYLGLGQKQAVIDKHGKKTCERRNQDIEYAALTITKQF